MGKVKSEPTFLCVACKIGKKLSALEDRVSVLEDKAKELHSIKDGLKDIRIALIDLQCVSNKSDTNNITTEQLRVNLSPVKQKNYAVDKLSEKILIIGNSFIKNVSSRDGLTKIVSVSDAGIQKVKKELQGYYQKM